MRALVLALVLAGCLAPDVPGPVGADASWTWTTLAEAPTPRTEVAVAADGARFFVVGGFVADGRVVGTVEVYDAEADAWSRAPDLPVGLHHTMAAVVDGAVYVFGGFAQPTAPVGAGAVFLPVVTDAVWRLDAGASSWTPVSRMPVARASGGAVAVDGKVVVAAGLGQDLGLVAATHVYDPASDRWTDGAPIPTPRDHLGAAALDGEAWFAGGQELSHAASVRALESYDPATDRWTTHAPNPLERNSMSAAAWDGRIVVLGGQDAERTFADVEAYDPVTATWATLPPMPTARHGFGAATWDGRLYAVAGGPEPGLSVTGSVEALAR